MKNKVVKPLYQQVALNLAQRVAEGYYAEGEKLHTRSTIAKSYDISPETARKAVQVLDDLGIMESYHGSGTYVASREKAQTYVRQFQDVQTIENMKSQILDSVERQQKEWKNFSQLLDDVITQTRQSYTLNPFIPYELVLTKEAAHLDQTVADLNVWQETGATIVALMQNEKLLLSPGPYAKLNENDTIYFVGNEYSLQYMRNFFYPKP
ncbi:GntR family transcriptional regulator [Jeotgalibaca ciconiae]|uniref:GntR family transcriptional regulator n=1 Tax=Jeotgalibaca ciconiae TaxID=2496265 RepID=A0A3Q9BKW7_9LACT|nr:GntR family transcriptional regulator [Jeotgalibaca ciconiae]AZP03620.1 GntR family transcriptional regulator [Jeotgalibaca ciconiae]HJB24248.1 GntR family transcriptional regulator [Candidatus Jeotgalibaca pullicola]